MVTQREVKTRRNWMGGPDRAQLSSVFFPSS
jgi:hypothetical protein